MMRRGFFVYSLPQTMGHDAGHGERRQIPRRGTPKSSRATGGVNTL